MNIKLTPHQFDKYEYIIDHLNAKQNCILFGSAGVGKSVVANYIANQFKYNDVVLLAPTHKARKVLEVKSSRECSTIHSYLGLTMKRKGIQKVFLPPYTGLQVPRNKILIIDEASMVGKKDSPNSLLDYLFEAHAKFNNTLLFLGDSKQLYPVGENESPVFNLDLPKYELEEIIRQGESNDNIDLSRNLHWLNEKKKGKYFDWNITHDDAINMLAQVNGTDDLKYITWTNKKVSQINNEVRKVIYENPDQFMEGESIVLIDVNKEDKYKARDEVYIQNLSKRKIMGFETWVINYDLYILDEKEKRRYDIAVKDALDRALKDRRKWKDYYFLTEAFVTYHYNHAGTCHSAQGSTYKDSILDISLMSQSPEDIRDKMLYTAVTRTSNFNYLI